MKRPSIPARRPSAGAGPGRGGICLVATPHRPRYSLLPLLVPFTAPARLLRQAHRPSSPRRRRRGLRRGRVDVVVAGGGVVAGDQRRQVVEERPQVVDAATDALAVAAALARGAAVGLVEHDLAAEK